ncbi:nucleoside phosphorylase [Dongshaea marina]|uniref:nucleoside phosphorylase n=1 Tax=Dongshaea marina TaxID=2047966 RepID=UPI000D3E0A73|nr:nucleoside phosphorylase [Dongshaea marina]
MSLQPHINCAPEWIAPAVLICGEAARVDRIARLLDRSEIVSENREYRVCNGYYRDKAVTLCSTGMGAPSTIIGIEELKLCGAERIIRVGSAGALQPEIALGDLILVEGAVRCEGGSRAYVEPEYPALSDFRLTSVMADELRTMGHPFHSGLVRSHDSFYTDREDEICAYWHQKGVLGADMETSALLTVGRLRGLLTGSVLNNVVCYQGDLQQGISQYANSEQILLNAELKAAQAALSALIS